MPGGNGIYCCEGCGRDTRRSDRYCWRCIGRERPRRDAGFWHVDFTLCEDRYDEESGPNDVWEGKTTAVKALNAD